MVKVLSLFAFAIVACNADDSVTMLQTRRQVENADKSDKDAIKAEPELEGRNLAAKLDGDSFNVGHGMAEDYDEDATKAKVEKLDADKAAMKAKFGDRLSLLNVDKPDKDAIKAKIEGAGGPDAIKAAIEHAKEKLDGADFDAIKAAIEAAIGDRSLLADSKPDKEAIKAKLAAAGGVDAVKAAIEHAKAKLDGADFDAIKAAIQAAVEGAGGADAIKAKIGDRSLLNTRDELSDDLSDRDGWKDLTKAVDSAAGSITKAIVPPPPKIPAKVPPSAVKVPSIDKEMKKIIRSFR